ncbi:unnamed protein product [Clonostachys byssicola]|uniref:Uncharacterized protein n=1 Tax=Clonostachys byssicola TaxID=160290 RepID=A0A9N9USY3_9HYPO|nr:unnamed protein product [Clonostachys byssicola]
MSRHGDKYGHGHGRGGFNHPVLESLGIGALTLGGAAAAIGASWKVAEFLVKCKTLFEVRSENAVYVRLVERVKVDLAEAERLMALKSVQDGMRENREKTLYVQSLIRGVHDAIKGMTKYTSKVADAGKWMGLPTRLWWVLHEREKLAHRQMELAMAREGIMEVIGWLGEFEGIPKKAKEASEDRRGSVEHRKEDGRDVRHTSNHVDVHIDTRRHDDRRDERWEKHSVSDHGRHPIRRDERWEKHSESDHGHHPIHRDERWERHVVESDHGRPPMRMDEERRRYEYVEDFDDEDALRHGDWKQNGFYDGRPDGPLATRPRFLSMQSPGANYTESRIRERVDDGGPLPREQWPSKL